ncbi:small polypeptide DEVIL 16 [Nicotiana tomentosiformis]|uniref:small polypeptide DEVIL 16 n=1 Tax=Nicotiana tomentosiformis TaxID=4098 RepID=UPI00051AF15C|nr:uncharacterized protein LOC104118111 [Nicotiana tomentosiformis]
MEPIRESEEHNNNSEDCCGENSKNSKSFGKKCSHIAKKQRAKFYIVRRCIAMLVCWRDRKDH